MAAPTLTQYNNGQGLVSADQLNTFQQTCDNLAQLRDLTGTVGMQVYVRGTVVPGDGGHGEFYWNVTATGPDDNSSVIVPSGNSTILSSAGAWVRLSSSLSASDSSATYVAAVHGSPVKNHLASFFDTKGTIADSGYLPIQWYNVVSYGADATGATDSTSAIQAAITACQNASGGVVYFPAGKYACTNFNITKSNVKLRGDGPKVSVLAPTSATGHFVTFGDGSNANLGCSFQDLAIVPTATRTSGCNIYLNYVQDFFLDRVWMQGGYNGIGIDENSLLSGKFLQNFWISSVTNHGIIIGKNSAVHVGDVFITNGIINNPGQSGVVAAFTSGLYCTQVLVGGAGSYGWLISPGASQMVVTTMLSQCLADTCSGHGFYLSGTGLIGDFQMSQCWGSFNTGNGFLTDNNNANTRGISINAGDFSGNTQYGILLNGAGNYMLTGVMVFNNSTSGSGLFAGIAVASNVSAFQILGCMSGRGGFFGQNACLQSYGIQVVTGASDYYIIQNNRCGGNVTGGVQDNGTGSHKFVGNNLAG